MEEGRLARCGIIQRGEKGIKNRKKYGENRVERETRVERDERQRVER